jgi:Chaperone of endosialidase
MMKTLAWPFKALIVTGLSVVAQLSDGQENLSANRVINSYDGGAGDSNTNTTGSYLTGLGVTALWSNTTGNVNTGIGFEALVANTTGNNNTATGAFALDDNTAGSDNTASGVNALFFNTTGPENTATGTNALYQNTTGKENTACGAFALQQNTSGANNIGLGFKAGYYTSSGSNNIEIGAPGTSNDNDTIQIGVQGMQTSTTIAGIYGSQVSGGSAMYVTSTGQLGVQGSSERFKTDIATMPEVSEKLNQLRPVTFHYKTDLKGIQQYGLIAEEVDKVYPELVIHNPKGEIQGIHYEELAPILLNEVQKQQQTIAAQSEHAAAQDRTINLQATKLDALSARNDAQVAEIRDLKKLVVEMQAGLLKLQAKGELVAQR